MGEMICMMVDCYGRNEYVESPGYCVVYWSAFGMARELPWADDAMHKNLPLLSS